MQQEEKLMETKVSANKSAMKDESKKDSSNLIVQEKATKINNISNILTEKDIFK